MAKSKKNSHINSSIEIASNAATPLPQQTTKKDGKKKSRRKRSAPTFATEQEVASEKRDLVEVFVNEREGTVSVAIQTEPTIRHELEQAFVAADLLSTVVTEDRTSPPQKQLLKAMLDLKALLPAKDDFLCEDLCKLDVKDPKIALVISAPREPQSVPQNNNNYGMKAIELVALGLKLYESVHRPIERSKRG